MTKLTGKQKRFLRAPAHNMNPVFQIGKNYLSEEVVVEYEDALSKRELMKVQVLQNATITAKEAAALLKRTLQLMLFKLLVKF